MCNCNCYRRIQSVVPTTAAVAAGVTTLTLPASFTPMNGGIYDIPLSVAIPDGTNGTEISITNGTVTGNLLNRLGSNVRMGTLSAGTTLRVMYLEDPSHWNLISVRRKCSCS